VTFDRRHQSSRERPIGVAAGARVNHSVSTRVQHFGETDIARKPNYDFERRERERTKAAESAKKAQAKADKRSEPGTPETDDAGGS